MLIPPNLKKGDTIGILATARKYSAEQLTFCIDLLHSWGYKTVLGKSIGAEDHQFAGDDLLRANDLQTFMDDPGISAILCARGGYGTMRIIDHLDISGFKKNPKWIFGFSDVTVLHQYFLHHGIASVHSSMPSLFPENTDHPTLRSIRNILQGDSVTYTWDCEPSFYMDQKAEGELVGGNLSLIYALQGSAEDLNTDGKILFLEDLDEYLYHIDRMMCSLDRSGKLKNLKALLIGGMTEMKDNFIPFGSTVEEIILHYAGKYGYPVFFGFPSGHIEHNYAIKFGVNCSIELLDKKLIFKQ